MSFADKYDDFKISVFTASPTNRSEFYRLMSDALASGISQFAILSQLKKYLKPGDPMMIVVNRVLRRLRGAEKGSDATERSVGTELRGMFPSVELLMISAGESSGEPAQGWANAANYAENRAALLKSIIWSLVKPVIYIVAFLAIMFYISVQILPELEEAIPRAGWPEGGQRLAWISDHIMLITGGTIGSLVGITLLMIWAKDHWVGMGREWADRKLPIFGVFTSVIGAGFLMALASFTASGVSFKRAMETLLPISSPYMRWQVRKIMRMFDQGIPINDALIKTTLIDPKHHWIFGVYGTIGSSDAAKSYEKISTKIRDQTTTKVKTVFDIGVSNIVLLLLAVGILMSYYGIYEIAMSAGGGEQF